MRNCKNNTIDVEAKTQAINQFIIFLEKFGLVSIELKEFLVSHLSLEFVKKNTVFWPACLPSAYIYFVCDGIVRSTYLDSNGRESTNWLVGTGDIAAHPTSLFSGTLSNDNMIAVTDALIIKFPYTLLKDNFERFACLNTIRVAILERYIIDYEEKVRAMRHDTFERQIDNYQKHYPKIFYNVPLHILASFFGFSKTTLIRFRRFKN